MLVDYLRYVAFNGRLHSFFADAVNNYVEPTATTGQHLRYAPNYVQELRKDLRYREPYWQLHSRESPSELLMDLMGISGGPDNLTRPPPAQNGAPPSTFEYTEFSQPRLQIIVDIHPDRWSRRYSEQQTFEETPILFRRAGVAKTHLRSGDLLVDSGQTGSGTLCGILRTSDGRAFGLTCGHVAGNGSQMLVQDRRRIWKLPLWFRSTVLGDVRYQNLPGSANLGSAQTQLDAALIEIRSSLLRAGMLRMVSQATIKPMSSVLQEEPVHFRGAGRRGDSLARVSAITVRKQIDLLKDGVMRDVGDVLMLGHLQPMYIVQPVSRPGDSGAAVRQGTSAFATVPGSNQWYGMILGGDECAYATHAEHLWAWAVQEIGDAGSEFAFEA